MIGADIDALDAGMVAAEEQGLDSFWVALATANLAIGVVGWQFADSRRRRQAFSDWPSSPLDRDDHEENSEDNEENGRLVATPRTEPQQEALLALDSNPKSSDNNAWGGRSMLRWDHDDLLQTGAVGTANPATRVLRRARDAREEFATPRKPPMKWRRRWSGLLWLSGCLLVGGCLLLKAFPALQRRATPLERPTDASTATTGSESPGLLTKKIEDIRVGERVLGQNPDGQTLGDPQLDPATWRRLKLRAEWRWIDGTLDVVNVETLQPPEWLVANQIHIGALVPLPQDLVELGMPETLRAEVLANDPCPPIPPGPGQVVLTTVNHLNPDVWQLTFEDAHGRRESLRPTAIHRFYRDSDGCWVSACDLRLRDRIRGRLGNVTLVASQRLAGVQRVYNLTVDGEHVYYVCLLGVLTHNASSGPIGPPPKDIHNNPAAAIGDLNGVAKLQGKRPTKDVGLIAHGYTETHYYVDSNGIQHTVFYNPTTKMYFSPHPSSGFR